MSENAHLLGIVHVIPQGVRVARENSQGLVPVLLRIGFGVKAKSPPQRPQGTL